MGARYEQYRWWLLDGDLEVVSGGKIAGATLVAALANLSREIDRLGDRGHQPTLRIRSSSQHVFRNLFHTDGAARLARLRRGAGHCLLVGARGETLADRSGAFHQPDRNLRIILALC